MKRALMMAAALALSGGALGQSKSYDSGTTYTLRGCVRDSSSGVECTFDVVNPRQDRTFYWEKGNQTIISPSGRERQISEVTFNNAALPFYRNMTIRKGIKYQIKMTFADFPENVIRYYDFDNETRWENVPIRTSATAASPATPAPAATGARSTNELPGQVEWRQRVRLDNTNYLAIVHGCFRAKAGATTASCLVTLMSDNPSGKAISDMVLYAGSLVQFNGQRINGDTVNLQVGDSLIRAIPVR